MPARKPPRPPSPTSDLDDDLWELTSAHIMDVLENGTYAERTAIVNKFGPVLMKKKDGEDVTVDIEAVKAEVRGWIEATGRSFFND